MTSTVFDSACLQSPGAQGASAGVAAADGAGGHARGQTAAPGGGAQADGGHRGPGEAAASGQLQQLGPAAAAAAAHDLRAHPHRPRLWGHGSTPLR